ncbi:MAG: glycoside hydrolase family 9 protein [Opitutaceae bacterium]
MRKSSRLLLCLGLIPWFCGPAQAEETKTPAGLTINELEYLEMPGLNVMLAQDIYPEGHQGGVSIIQNGRRVATNGDLRIEPPPGRSQPLPKIGPRQVDLPAQEISVRMNYPGLARAGKSFNPAPDQPFSYVVKIVPAGRSFRIIVDLDQPLPEAWVGRVGFNLELFPGILFGKAYYLDRESGIFPRQAGGAGYRNEQGGYQAAPLATGGKLVIAPESDAQRLTIERVAGGELQLLDGRNGSENGWFIVRALVPQGAATHAIEWLVTPQVLPGWISPPVVQVSQVGYHPRQPKVAVIETDVRDTRRLPASLYRIPENGGLEKVLEAAPKDWGRFLRYRYFQFDFSAVAAPGMYVVQYGDYRTSPFQISPDVFQRQVWQPTLEYFLPIQMCHMRVSDGARLWHGPCHLDDARMAPINHVHFDEYSQGPSTLCAWQPGEHVPGLNQGGWHDAGDYDLRIESQSETIRGLALAYEAFHVDFDATTVDQKNHAVKLHQPDGKPDMLQQIEHGALFIVGCYQSLGRLCRGVIEPTMQQYTQLGDPTNLTDNKVFDPKTPADPVPPIGRPGSADDRWVFTEDNPPRELEVAAGLAAASRALQGFNDGLSQDCLRVARQLWDVTREKDPLQRVGLAVELLAATKDRKYADFLTGLAGEFSRDLANTGWLAARSLSLVDDEAYRRKVREALQVYRATVDRQAQQTPYGVPYEPKIWGAGWEIQRFGMEQYFLHTACPDIFPASYMLNAMNFMLGCHPGANTASLVSGVGARSLTVAYGFNRADWSYIPGGIASGTALIRPDFPELLTWPFLWQQTEYVLGGGTTDYLFLVLAADHLLNK